MWKVERRADGEFVLLNLSGRIEGEHLAELERIVASEARNRAIVLDLKEVKLVDRDAVNFLASCEAAGTKLCNCPPYIREWISCANREGDPCQPSI
jgi:anti-anti-sigma regulatory factor